MNSSRGQVATTRSQRAPGLAVPTLVAALVCGGSVFAIAATGALALDSGVPTTVSVSRLDPLSAADPAAAPIPTAPIPTDPIPTDPIPTAPIPTMPMPAVAGTAPEPDAPAAVALPREPIRPRPRTPIEASGDAPAEAPSQAPVEAPTGVQYSVAVHGPGYDAPRGAVAVAAEPSVEFLGYGPTSSAPSPSVTPSATWVTDAR